MGDLSARLENALYRIKARGARIFIGIELKRSYYDQARENLRRAEERKTVATLFGAVARAEVAV